MAQRALYLNHAGTSWPKPRAVSNAVRDAMLTAPTEWPRRFEEAHQAIADFFGVTRREQILLTPGCTSALAVGIADALVDAGKRVLTSEWEHHALSRPLLKLAATGVQIDKIPPLRGSSTTEHIHPVDLDWLERALAGRDVSLVAITAACNVTGELLPYEEVIEIAHRFGAMVLIDAAQIVGWRKLDLNSMGADMVAFGGHKGLQAAWGIGGLYISERAEMSCRSTTCELPAVAQNERNQHMRPSYCDVGSVDQFALAGLHAGIRLIQQEDAEARLAVARAQIERIRSMLERIDRVRLYGPREPERRMPSLAFAASDQTSSDVASKLRRRLLTVGSGLHCAPLAHETLGTQASGLVRLSVGLGQPDEEVDEAIERLNSVLSN